MHYIIVDLEATCWENKALGPNEIIEIGAVCINASGEIAGEFCSFAKPSVHPVLSDFCVHLTSITQGEIDDAPSFPIALDKFTAWIKSFGSEYYLCSWGNYDRTQFAKDCARYSIDTGWLKHHISLKHQYAEINDIRPCGMKAALTRESIALEGTHHRGIDDARNIAKIFQKYLGQWKFSN